MGFMVTFVVGEESFATIPCESSLPGLLRVALPLPPKALPGLHRYPKLVDRCFIIGREILGKAQSTRLRISI